jgi:hypothetical protein
VFGECEFDLGCKGGSGLWIVDWNLGIVSILTTGIYSGLCCCVSEGGQWI